MFKVIMVSEGGTKRDFHDGFNTMHDAIEFVSSYNWRWYDENMFCWSLDIEEYGDIKDDIEETSETQLIIPNPEWARTFIKFQQRSDSDALSYLDDVFEDNFNREERLKYKAIRNLVYGLIHLNTSITEFEADETEDLSYDQQLIVDGYRSLMQLLLEIAEHSLTIV